MIQSAMVVMALSLSALPGLGLGFLDDRHEDESVEPMMHKWRLIYHDAPEKKLSWAGLAYLLGGVELTAGFGQAGVSSRVLDENGDRFLIASGNEPETSFSVSLYGGPSSTGWRFGPTGGWFTREIAIQDFAAQLPGGDPMRGVVDVPGECRDPDSGESISCQAPNVYDLALQSFYAGAMGGYEVLVGNSRFQLMGGLYGTINALEFRRTRITVADESVDGKAWKVIRSGGVQATAGVRLPRLHSAFRVTFDYQRFARFDFAQPLEFRGPVVYDEDRQMYIRPRYQVEDTALGVLGLKFSAALVF